MGHFLKERICSCRSKFFPLRVDSLSKSYSSKEGIGIHAHQYNINFGKEQRAIIRADRFIRSNKVGCALTSESSEKYKAGSGK